MTAAIKALKVRKMNGDHRPCCAWHGHHGTQFSTPRVHWWSCQLSCIVCVAVAMVHLSLLRLAFNPCLSRHRSATGRACRPSRSTSALTTSYPRVRSGCATLFGCDAVVLCDSTDYRLSHEAAPRDLALASTRVHAHVLLERSVQVSCTYPSPVTCLTGPQAGRRPSACSSSAWLTPRSLSRCV